MFLAVLLGLSALAKTAHYSSAQATDKYPRSSTDKYVAYCTEASTPAVLVPRTEPNRVIYPNPKRVLTTGDLPCVKIAENELYSSVVSYGYLPSLWSKGLKSHSLLHLHCLLIV